MYAISLLEKWRQGNCFSMRQARKKAVVKMVRSLLLGGKATLTELGRHLGETAFEDRQPGVT